MGVSITLTVTRVKKGMKSIYEKRLFHDEEGISNLKFLKNRKKNDGREMKMTIMLGGVVLVERSWNKNKKKRDCFYFLFFKCC